MDTSQAPEQPTPETTRRPVVHLPDPGFTWTLAIRASRTAIAERLTTGRQLVVTGAGLLPAAALFLAAVSLYGGDMLQFGSGSGGTLQLSLSVGGAGSGAHRRVARAESGMASRR